MLTIKNLTKKFNKKVILENLSTEINAGERVALVGQNGCGKTTFIRCLLGLYKFDGEINIHGFSLNKNRQNALTQIAFVPQTPPPLKHTVQEMISFTAHLCGLSADDVEHIAGRMNLYVSHCRNTPFKNLSGGMKQKLLISLALARRPSILIMDEPSANLDTEARSHFFQLLSELPKDTIMLLTSHRLDELSGIVSRVIEIDNGRMTMDDLVSSGSKNTLTEFKYCILKFKSLPDSVTRTLHEWNFQNQNDVWSGYIPSSDSFRFHSTLTRWSGIIENVTIKTVPTEDLPK